MIIDYVNQHEIKLNIYPNPTKGLLIIGTEEIIKSISIINTLGNELVLVENNNNLISLYNDTIQGEIVYRLTFDSKNQLNLFKKKIEGIKSINKIITTSITSKIDL